MSFHTHYPLLAYIICKTVLRQSWASKTKILTKNRHWQSSTDAPQPKIENQQPTTMNADDDRLLSTYTFDNRHTIVINHQSERQKMTTDTQQRKPDNRCHQPNPSSNSLLREQTTNDSQQPLPVSDSWPGKDNNKRQSNNHYPFQTADCGNKQQMTVNNHYPFQTTDQEKTTTNDCQQPTYMHLYACGQVLRVHTCQSSCTLCAWKERFLNLLPLKSPLDLRLWWVEALISTIPSFARS